MTDVLDILSHSSMLIVTQRLHEQGEACTAEAKCALVRGQFAPGWGAFWEEVAP